MSHIAIILQGLQTQILYLISIQIVSHQYLSMITGLLQRNRLAIQGSYQLSVFPHKCMSLIIFLSFGKKNNFLDSWNLDA